MFADLLAHHLVMLLPILRLSAKRSPLHRLQDTRVRILQSFPLPRMQKLLRALLSNTFHHPNPCLTNGTQRFYAFIIFSCVSISSAEPRGSRPPLSSVRQPVLVLRPSPLQRKALQSESVTRAWPHHCGLNATFASSNKSLLQSLSIM